MIGTKATFIDSKSISVKFSKKLIAISFKELTILNISYYLQKILIQIWLIENKIFKMKHDKINQSEEKETNYPVNFLSYLG